MTPTVLKKNLLDVLDTGNRDAVQEHLSLFRVNGRVNYLKTMEIPSSERITALIQQDGGFIRVAAAIVASLKSAMENLNLKYPLTEDQLIELSEMIIEESEYDYLALEDILLFLEKLVKGLAGTIYDRMDTPTFFVMFNDYRDKRHKVLVEYRENKHLEYKSLGDPSRSTKPETIFEEHLASFSNKLQIMKDELKELKGKK